MRETNTTAEVFDRAEDKDTLFIPLEGISAEDVESEVPEDDRLVFPVHVFPEPFKTLIEATQEALNYQADYTGTSLLVAVSTAMGNTARIQVKKNWLQVPIIYAGLVGRSGVSKTHPLKWCLDVFGDDDARELRRYAEDVKQYKLALQRYNKGGKKAADPPPEPTPLQTTVLTQATPEAIVKHLQGNKRGCVMYSDELPVLFETLANYSKTQNTSFLLEGWGGNNIAQYRVEESRFVASPYMNIIGGIQKRRMREVFGGKNADNGLLQRFLWAYPENSDKQPINDAELDDIYINERERWFREFKGENTLNIDRSTDRVLPTFYTFTPEAWDCYKGVQHTNTTLVNSYGDCLEAEVLSKFDDHLARLSLVMHKMSGSPENTVGAEAVIAAATLCEYYASTSLKVVALITNKGATLSESEAAFLTTLPETFTTAQALTIGKELGVSERSVYVWLEHPKFSTLLSKVRHGEYRKL